jgi:pheromone shutdown protein TraB
MDASPAIDVDSDPRVTGEYVRQVSDEHGTLTLVGIVHDHPASIYRVRHVIEGIDPEVLALELPAISLPLFEQYAATEQTPPALGGEMSAAIQAADTDTVVGIDRPTIGYCRWLGRNLLRERPPLETVRNVVSNTLETTKNALLCLAAAAVGARFSIRLEVGSPIPHDIAWTDPAADQACHEREQVHRCRSFMDAFRTASRSRASRLEDAAREAAMTARLAKLRGDGDGDMVVVVGIGHLDPLADGLAERG